MAFRLNGVLLGDHSRVNINNVFVQILIEDGNVVWTEYDGPPSPLIISASGDFEAGVDFPANVSLNICCVGAGGSGSSTQGLYPAGGGHQGQIVEQNITLANGEEVSAIIGAGGSSVNNGNKNGNVGGATSFGSYVTASGGPGGTANSTNFKGNGETFISECDGSVRANGVYKEREPYSAWGGQWGAYGDGGRGWNYDAAGIGGIGAGGGGVTSSYGGGESSGAGGRGQIIVSW